MKRALEVLIYLVLISGGALGAFVLNEAIAEDERIRTAEITTLQARIDSLEAQMVRDSIRFESIRHLTPIEKE